MDAIPATRTALPDWLPRHMIDVAACYGMACSGSMAPADPPHAGCVIALTESLQPALAEGASVSVHNPVR
jgi:hypothetical protein